MISPAGDSGAAFTAAFTGAARRYWLGVFPRVCREVRHWRARALEISDPNLRRLALDAHDSKRTNLEGAAAFAAFAVDHRPDVVRALTAYQTIFDYLDVLAEQPSSDPAANGRRLNAALLAALAPEEPHVDYYEHHTHRDDGGYLVELIDACRAALERLPSFVTVAASARRAAQRMIAYQSLNHGDPNGSHESFDQWARWETQPETGLRWWETAAAAGSSLAALALIAAAVDPALRLEAATAIEGAYFPWIGALHSLLDSLIDRAEDAATGNRGLIDYYPSLDEAAARMTMIAGESLRLTRGLPHGRQHALVLAAMASHYLSMPEAFAPDARFATHSILGAMGGIAVPPMLVMGARRQMLRRSRLERPPARAPARLPVHPPVRLPATIAA
jgi:tetraprenyl-beta-curcumene synthase